MTTRIFGCVDRLEAMSVLLAAVDAGSLSAASRKLGVPLATVSRKVSELERHLRTRLLNRTSRRLILTDAGRSYVATCRRILEEIGEAERAAAGEYSRAQRRADHHRADRVRPPPRVAGRSNSSRRILRSTHVFAWRITWSTCRKTNVDLAVRIGELPDSSLMAIRVGTIRRWSAAVPPISRSAARRKARRAPRTTASLSADESPDGWRFPRGKVRLRSQIHSRLTVNTAEAAIDAAIADWSANTRPLISGRDAIRAGVLVVALREFEPRSVAVNLIHAGQGLLPLKLRAMLDFAAPRLKARLAQTEE